jgi:hypothetical protein
VRELATNLLGLYETQTLNCTIDVFCGLPQFLREITGSVGLPSLGTATWFQVFKIPDKCLTIKRTRFVRQSATLTVCKIKGKTRKLKINWHFDVTLQLHTMQTKIVQNECQTFFNPHDDLKKFNEGMKYDKGYYSFRDYHMFLLTRYLYVCGCVPVGPVGLLLRPEQFYMVGQVA